MSECLAWGPSWGSSSGFLAWLLDSALSTHPRWPVDVLAQKGGHLLIRVSDYLGRGYHVLHAFLDAKNILFNRQKSFPFWN